MISEKRIAYLFEVLWPGMMQSQVHQYECLKQYVLIEKLFIKHGTDFTSLLAALDQLDGIGVPIGTGLIWTAYPTKAIPFDKYTTSYCIKKEWIRSERISSNYNAICKSIVIELKKWMWTDGRKFTIEDLVREAMEEMKFSEYLTSPV